MSMQPAQSESENVMAGWPRSEWYRKPRWRVQCRYCSVRTATAAWAVARVVEVACELVCDGGNVGPALCCGEIYATYHLAEERGVRLVVGGVVGREELVGWEREEN